MVVSVNKGAPHLLSRNIVNPTDETLVIWRRVMASTVVQQSLASPGLLLRNISSVAIMAIMGIHI